MFGKVFVLIVLGLICVQCMPREFFLSPTLDTDEDILSESVLNRPKRTLATICVEIKPSAPQEEPYYMCKGADVPAFHKGRPTGSTVYAGSNAAIFDKLPYTAGGGGNHGGGGGSNFQNFPAKSYDTKLPQQSTFHEGSSHGGFQNPSSVGGQVNAYSGQTEYQQQHRPTQSFPNVKPPFPIHEAGQPNHGQSTLPQQDFHQGYEPLYAAEKPKQSTSPYAPQHFTGFGSPASGSGDVAHTPTTTFHKGYPGSSSGHGAYKTQPTYHQHEFSNSHPAYGQSAKSNGQQHGGPHGQPFPSATYSDANFKGPSYGQGVFHTTPTATTAFKTESATRTTATPGNPTYVVPAVPKSGAAYVKPSGTYQYQTNPTKTSGRDRAMIDEHVFGRQTWHFSPQEHNVYRPPPADEAVLGSKPRQSVHGDMHSPQQYRTIPKDHLEDPIMREFYASLGEPIHAATPPLPASAPVMPVTSVPIPDPFLSSSYSADPLANPQTHYNHPTARPSAPCSSHGACGYSNSPTHPATCAPCASYGHAPATLPQQYLAASESDAHYMAPTSRIGNQCSREFNVQPIYIALPCYGQQGYGQNSQGTVGALNNFALGANLGLSNLFGMVPSAYQNFGIPNQMANLYPSSELDNLGMSFPNANLYSGIQSDKVAAMNPFSPIHRFGALNPLNPLNRFNIFNPLSPLPLLAEAKVEKSDVRSNECEESAAQCSSKMTEKPSKIVVTESPESFEDLQHEAPKKSMASSHKKKEQNTSGSQEDVQQVSEEILANPEVDVTPITLKLNTDKSEEELTTQAETDEILGASLAEEQMGTHNLEEESQKTFTTLMSAAKQFARIAKREEAPEDTGTLDMVDISPKRSGTGSTGYKRIYKQKL